MSDDIITNLSGARHRSARQNICSDEKFSWLENRADISRADDTCPILIPFTMFYIVSNQFEKIPND